MTDHFEFFSFSAFDYDDIATFANVVKNTFREDIGMGRAVLDEVSNLSVESYFNPPSGGTHDDVFSFWKIKSSPNRIFFSSNTEDGRFTLCNVLYMKLRCSFVMCSLSNHITYPLYHFHYSNSNMEERDILAYKDPKWTFCTKGIPLDFEDLKQYKRKRISDRLNNHIIKSYLLEMGIDFEKIDVDITQSYTFIRKL